jgi:hypothetical protein
MAESLSRLRNPRAESKPEEKAPEHVDTGEMGDHHHAAAEALHTAEPGSKHMIVSHDGYSYRSHGIHEDGKHEPEEGTHDHENLEALKSHMGKFFDEEEQEGKEKEDGGPESEENQSLY